MKQNPKGIGWELFVNYLIAIEKFKPDYFIYENNKSASPLIKQQISSELGVPLQHIDSALVSAQKRERFYAHNIPNVPIPEDRGILLKDILDSGVVAQEKSYCLTGTYAKRNCRDYFKKKSGQVVFEPVRIGTIGSNSQAHRVYSCNGKSINITANGGGQGAKTGLYLTPVAKVDIPKALNNGIVYEACNGFIHTEFGDIPVNLDDGYYRVRKLTPEECERLQTLPTGYTAGISPTQRYKCLGNGWTAQIIIHLLNHALKDVPRDEEIIVLSMYDGIATGRYCFDALGYTNVTYFAYEIDPYAIKIATKNYPDIICCGDAFQIRNGGISV